MALKVITLSQAKLEILLAPDRHGLTVTETCRRYGISRQSFYQYRRRCCAAGLVGLEAGPQRPNHWPQQTPAEVEAMIIAMRCEWPAGAPASSAPRHCRRAPHRQRSPPSTRPCAAIALSPTPPAVDVATAFAGFERPVPTTCGRSTPPNCAWRRDQGAVIDVHVCKGPGEDECGGRGRS
jgi:hypothetical protein